MSDAEPDDQTLRASARRVLRAKRRRKTPDAKVSRLESALRLCVTALAIMAGAAWLASILRTPL